MSNGMALVLSEGSHNGLRPELRAIMATQRSIPRPYHYKQSFITWLIYYLFITWLICLALTSVISKPLWNLLGHYGSVSMSCACHIHVALACMAIVKQLQAKPMVNYHYDPLDKYNT